MPGNITLDMFEFVNYDHPLTTSGSGETILMRERVPRRMSNGHFMRCHLNADGSASTLTSDDGNFDAMPGNALGSGTPPVTP
jgi:hypothetical protein